MSEPLIQLLDELRIIAQNGRIYADNPYDKERYTRILELVSEHYAELTDATADEIQDQFENRLGYTTPNVGGRAVIINEEGRVLVMKRSGTDEWGIPGGYTEPGETPAETAVRETKEETGLDVEPVQQVTFVYREPDKANPHGFVGAVYYCRVVGGTFEHSHESERLEYRLFTDVPEWHKDDGKVSREALDYWRNEVQN